MLIMKKITHYSDIFTIGSRKVLFNLSNGAIIELDEESIGKYYSLEKNDIQNVFSEEELKILSENGFLIDDSMIKSRIKLSYHKSKYSDQQCLKLDIAVTDQCNFVCPYCFEGTRKKNDNTAININTLNNFTGYIIEYIKKKISEETKFIEIVWYGGEPLLEKDTIIKCGQEIDSIAYDYGIKSVHKIITNGYLLDDEFLSILKKINIQFVQITLDGHKEIHNRSRNMIKKTDTYSIIMKNIRTALLKEIEVVIRINVDRKNYIYIPELFDEIKQELPNRYWGKTLFVDIARVFGSSTSFSLLEFEKVTRDLIVQATRLGLMTAKSAIGSLVAFCNAECSNSSLVVDLYGNTYKCWNYIFDEAHRTGNIIDYLNNTREVSSEEVDYVENLSLDCVNEGKCFDCKYINYCMGMCPYIRDRIRRGMYGNKFYKGTCVEIIRERIKTALTAYFVSEYSDSNN